MSLIFYLTTMLIIAACFSVSASAMEVTVNKDGDVAKTFKVESTDTVLSVKMKLMSEYGYPTARQELKAADTVLEDNKTLDHYQIKDGTGLSLTVTSKEWTTWDTKEVIMVGDTVSCTKTRIVNDFVIYTNWIHTHLLEHQKQDKATRKILKAITWP